MADTTRTTSSAPAPAGWPLLGNLPALARNPLAFFDRLRDLDADLVSWRLGGQQCVFVTRPSLIIELLGSVERSFTNAEFGPMFRALLGESVVVSRGDAWRRKRSLIQPALRPRQVREFAPIMVDTAEEMAESWTPGERIDVLSEMSRLTQRIVLRTLFGVERGGRELAIGRAMDTGQRAVAAEFRGLSALLPPWVPTPGRRRLHSAVAILDSEIDRIVAERAPTADSDPSVVGRLLAVRDEQGEALDHVEVRDELKTLYVAGHETTSSTLTWTWYLLGRHPEARERMLAELTRVVGDRPPAYTDLPALTWTQQVVKESMRLFPAVWFTLAAAPKQTRLGGVDIPAGTQMWISQWALHRDPRLYDEPAEFRPERWDPEARTPVPDHAWLPFGAGPRACLGGRFAQVEAALVLAALARRRHLELDPRPVKPTPSLNLRPSPPLRATVRTR